LRAASPNDAGVIVALEERLFSSDRMSLRSIRRFIAAPTARVAVACAGHETVAAMVLLLPRAPRPARLYSLGVAESQRRRGIARRLLALAERWARDHGADALILEVEQRNHGARKLYEAQGFAVTAELPCYYSDGADGLRMALSLRRRTASPADTRKSKGRAASQGSHAAPALAGTVAGL
jgi:[ribosomal protein S18]-alanine N-acetyltransferase